MDLRQRFRAERPCPVCCGHADVAQGEGSRCYGFLSADRYYAHCTREEYAGLLKRNGNSDTFAHYLKGGCPCGKEHGAGPAQARPVPRGSDDAPSVNSYLDPKLGEPSQMWSYWYADGELAGYAARWDKLDGGKEIRPLVLEDGRWLQKGIPKPRPLYNLPKLQEPKQGTGRVLCLSINTANDSASNLSD